MITTLNQIKSLKPCRPGWIELLVSLDKTEADDMPLDVLHILESNGVTDFFWLYEQLNPPIELSISIGVDFLESILDTDNRNSEDKRLCLAIETTKKWLANPTNENWEKSKDAYREAGRYWEAARIWDTWMIWDGDWVKDSKNIWAAKGIKMLNILTCDFTEKGLIQYDNQKAIIKKHLL